MPPPSVRLLASLPRATLSRPWLWLAVVLLRLAPGPILDASPSPGGLLFHVSADHGTTADFSATDHPAATFDSEVTVAPDGAIGPGLRCGGFQRLAWSAPGHIYAQRGTLGFFWRAREPLGPTAFPIFRVGYADHSSWDMVWLRIDYNGHGFDAFVTDASLARTRVSVSTEPLPAPTEWIHLALGWDETRGLRFFVNGRLVAVNETAAVYDAGLDQFGPHSRIISPYQVQSDYNFIRGGDVDEIRIYDHLLSDREIAVLARPEPLPANAIAPAAPRRLGETSTRQEWLLRHGWSELTDAPDPLDATAVAIRKVEIHDAFDLKRWWWKATDGIRETTWPGVYNRSRLPGRNDYFQLPDWDCYSESGKAVTFFLPDEPWNHVEISGAAWGRLTLGRDANAPLLVERPRGHERTVHAFPTARTGGVLTFTNAEQEQPIGEFSIYQVAPGIEPEGSAKLSFRLTTGSPADSPGLVALAEFIRGRYPADERQMLIGQPLDAIAHPAASDALAPAAANLPIVHVLIPDVWDSLSDGLDGLTLELPALAVAPTHGGRVPLQVRVADPLWPARALCDVTVSVQPNTPYTLWLDLRDRLLPPGRPLYLSVACASSEFSTASLAHATVRLVFKPGSLARAEHELDRFTQARDAYAMLVEEHPHDPKFALWVRFRNDLEDLLRVNPDHDLGRRYAAVALGAPSPLNRLPDAPTGVPLWAFRQTELLRRVKEFVVWYIDHRQIENGELGGGLSDDTDLTNTWPAVALMGSEPDKIARSLRRVLDACYANGMFTDGLPTIQTDELHSYEEGINCLSQTLLLDYGSPRQLERAMETARGVARLTGVNSAGHRHIRSSYFSGSKLAEDGPWGWSKPFSYLILHPLYLLSEFNGNPAAEKLLRELADGLLAHRKPGADSDRQPLAIHFATDAEGEAARSLPPWPLFWSAWRISGDAAYLAPIREGGLTLLSAVNANALDLLALRREWRERLDAGERPGQIETRRPDGRERARAATFRQSTPAHFAWQLTGDKRILENLYAQQIAQCELLEFINTEGSLWIDRVGVPSADLQRARLGGVALTRNSIYPGHVVSWRFAAPATAESVALLLPDATPTALKVIACNLSSAPVRAVMTGWDVAPGQWEIRQGVDTNDDDVADTQVQPGRTAGFERGESLEFTLPGAATTVVTLKLQTAGHPYRERCDLGFEREDVTRTAGGLSVRVHNLGSVPAPATALAVRDRAGETIARAPIAALAAPVDLWPRTADVEIALPANVSLDGATIEIDPEHALQEITRRNNAVRL